jgi:hypothetical protein
MSETVSEVEMNQIKPGSDIVAELTGEFHYWFADDFKTGDVLMFRVEGEVNYATVTSVEPADGTIVIDTSGFDRDSHQTEFMIADHSSTGPDSISHDFSFGIRAVPIDSQAAKSDSEVTHVLCECGTVCKSGRGYSVHQAQAHGHNDSDNRVDEHVADEQ